MEIKILREKLEDATRNFNESPTYEQQDVFWHEMQKLKSQIDCIMRGKKDDLQCT